MKTKLYDLQLYIVVYIIMFGIHVFVFFSVEICSCWVNNTNSEYCKKKKSFLFLIFSYIFFHTYKGITDKKWKEFYDSAKPHKEKVPAGWDERLKGLERYDCSSVIMNRFCLRQINVKYISYFVNFVKLFFSPDKVLCLFVAELLRRWSLGSKYPEFDPCEALGGEDC